ncbi:hypothetical protein PTI98_012056 [Pleurotus ostreatus]|nr:hypothetical protein PTI98_012056 [Pleurotus ostreatus]
MLRTILLIALSCSAYVLGSTPRPRQRVCGSQPSQERIQRAEAHFDGLRSNVSLNKESSFTVSVHWHVVSQNSTVRGGNIPCVKPRRFFGQDGDLCVSDSQITDQIKVLNDAYAYSGFSFELAGTTRTVNATWFGKAEPERFTSGYYYGLLGYATFPFEYGDNPKDDGVVIHYASVPGGNLDTYNLGMTATHEVGHWFGLYHTFEGGCDEPGDYVDDTPSESYEAFGCPIGRDTCDGEGLDPIHTGTLEDNYMDYTDDECMTEFTEGQGQRMREQSWTYRGVEARVASPV